MRRNMRIIQISGLRGILLGLFVATCLAAGFILFPGFVAMHLWNFSAKYLSMPTIGLVQGLMLWIILAIIVFIINDKQKFLVAFSPKNQLNDEEMRKLM